MKRHTSGQADLHQLSSEDAGILLITADSPGQADQQPHILNQNVMHTALIETSKGFQTSLCSFISPHHLCCSQHYLLLSHKRLLGSERSTVFLSRGSAMPYNLILNWSGPSRKHPYLGANLLPSLLKATRGRKDLFHLSIPLLHSIPEASQGVGT